ncbi:hypothetical protein [Streptomyces similanensis]|uniref:hypothetical protein n=1 Tax=Streptomyces similanensis TaxID=1274988 RepID=UPI0031EC9D62
MATHPSAAHPSAARPSAARPLSVGPVGAGAGTGLGARAAAPGGITDDTLTVAGPGAATEPERP